MSNEVLNQLDEIGCQISRLAKECVAADEQQRVSNEIKITLLVRQASNLVGD